MRAWLLLALVGCGRIGFDPHGGGVGDDGGGGDDGNVPAAPIVVTAAGPGAAQFDDIAIDATGKFVVVGSYGGTVNLQGSTATTAAPGGDYLLATFDPTGAIRQVFTLGATQIGSAQGVAWLPSGGIVASGYFGGTATRAGNVASGGSQDAVLVRLDPQETALPLTHYSGSQNVQGRALGVGHDTIAFGGIYGGTLTIGGPLTTASADNTFLAAMDLAGGVPVTRTLNGGNDIYINKLAIAADGSMCLAGRFNTTTNFGMGNVSATGGSGWVARYEPGFALRWVRSFGSNTQATGVAVTTSGDCVASGEVSGSLTIDGQTVAPTAGSDGWIARFDGATGALRWLHAITGDGLARMYGVAGVANDRVVLAGRITGAAMVATMAVQTDGPADAFFAGFSPTGDLEWLQQIGGSGEVAMGLTGVSTDPSGTRVGLAFTFNGELKFGDFTATSTGDDGIAIVIDVP